MKTNHLLDKSINELAEKYPHFSCKNLYLYKVRNVFLYITMFITICMLIDKNLIINSLIVIGSIIFICSIIFKITLLVIQLFHLITKDSYNPRNIYMINEKNITIPNDQLPTYTILIPLYKENKVINKLIKSIDRIDYPKDKLQVLLLLEQDDKQTIAIVKQQSLMPYYEVVIIPPFHPRTKPKACNYGLNFAKGKFITIFDAEDVPHRMQLKKVVEKFSKLDKKYICLQSKLNFFNREENLLTKFFAIEYSNWFEFMLPALYHLKMIIPLGGTSNHFKLDKLIEIGGWDPFNVTEDAELGIRLHFFGYKTSFIDSITYEESLLNIRSWIMQRSRWIKGYMKTYLLFLMNLDRYSNKLSKSKIWGIHLFMGISLLSYLSVFLLSAIYLLTITKILYVKHNYNIVIILWELSFYMGFFILIINALIIVLYHKWYDCIFSLFLYPIYNLLQLPAAFKALFQLFYNPYYWEKTTHGLTKMKINLVKINKE